MLGYSLNKTFKSKSRYSNHMIYFMPQDGGTKLSKTPHPHLTKESINAHVIGWKLWIQYIWCHYSSTSTLIHIHMKHMVLCENDECSGEPPWKKTQKTRAQSHISFAKFSMQGNRYWLQCNIKFSKRTKINVHKVPRRNTSWWYYKMAPPQWNQWHICYEWYQLINWCTPAFILCPCILHEDGRSQHNYYMHLCHIQNSCNVLPINKCPFDPDDEETVPDNSFTCMNCWFYKDFLVNAYQRLIQQNTCLIWALNKVQESLQYMNYPVHLLSNVLSHATTKFSIQGDSTYSVVTFSFHQRKCFAKVYKWNLLCTDVK